MNWAPLYKIKLHKHIAWLLVVMVSLYILVQSVGVQAATTPSLGAAASYGVLSSTYTNTSTSTINGDVGFTTPPAVAPGGTHNNYGSGGPYATAGADQGAALTALNNQPCTTTFPPGAVVITGTYTPGVYCSSGAMNLSGTITLNGAGTYIFRADGALNTAAGTIVELVGGASACDVFWTPIATTLGANTTFIGTVIDDAAITVGANTNWTGRALSFASTVTTDTTTITVPTCAAAPAEINVVKTVINDSGRTKVASDFPLFVSGTSVVSGATNTFPAPASYVVTETTDPNYTQTFSGDCDASGNISLIPGDNKFCIVTNDDIAAPVIVPPVPPLIELVKVPNPLNLPSGPGSVMYTYTLRNIGTVTATNITMVGDTCSPINLISGDTNSNAQLEVSETWTYTCTTTIPQTHTNNVVATGLAGGITTTEIASATTVVGSSAVPPLIHLTKVPNLFTVLSGGVVTYTLKVTNPGSAPLTNVALTDNTCSTLQFISGDTNGNAQLEPTETWTYTCSAQLTKTTTNTAIASGEANGLTARDFAIVIVVVGAVPGLPNTGITFKE